MRDLRQESGAAVILVTHDLGVVADIADRIAVMYAGRIVEEGNARQIFYDPQHPYCVGAARIDHARGQAASGAAARDRRAAALAGGPPRGCHFRPRCPHEFAQCTSVPPLEAHLPGDADHLDRCWPGQWASSAR